MPDRPLHHIRNNAVGYIALFVALGGTGYAALSLPANSVGTRQLRSGAVTSRKIAKGAVAASALDPKSIAGHIADWAQIRADGKVTRIAPQGERVDERSRTRLVPGVLEPVHSIGLRRGCESHERANCRWLSDGFRLRTGSVRTAARSLLVSTFDSGGNNVPENVNVLVICP